MRDLPAREVEVQMEAKSRCASRSGAGSPAFDLRKHYTAVYREEMKMSMSRTTHFNMSRNYLFSAGLEFARSSVLVTPTFRILDRQLVFLVDTLHQESVLAGAFLALNSESELYP